MRREICIDAVPGEVRVGLVEDGLLSEVLIERPGARGVAGNIYLGRVRTLLPGLQAAFVDLGLERDGFLYVEDAIEPKQLAGEDAPPPDLRIEHCLREGQEIVVQVVKDPMGTKGARITSHLALPGRFLVFLPGLEHVGVSRRIDDSDERERLRALVADLAARLGAPGGFIVRTTCAALATGDIEPDARSLLESWEAIRSLRERSSAPLRLHQEAGAVRRALREWLDEGVHEVVVETPELLREAIGFVEVAHPALAGRIRPHDGPRPLFEERGLQAQLDRALRPRVWLKSGGFIVINQTEALVAIDVNTGKYVGRGRHEETIVRTNLEAVREIVRQIRLRNLGGIIVIDLIDMQEPASRATVLEALERELRKDRARCRMLPISEFGLVEITRQRMRPGLDGVMCRPCPACGGAGRTKSFETLASEIVRELRSRGAALLEHRAVIRAHPEAAAAMRGRGAVLLAEIGCAAGGLEFEDDPGLRPDQWILRVD